MFQKILFVPIHGGSLLEMAPIAQKLVSDNTFEPVFFISSDIQERHLDLLDEKNFRKIHLNCPQKNDGREISQENLISSHDINKQKMMGLKKRVIKKLLSWVWFSFLFYFIKYARLLFNSKKLLSSEDVAGILVVGDRHIGWETALIKVANEWDIPTLIVPFDLSDPGSDAVGRFRKESVDLYRASSNIGRIFRRRFPNWVQETENGPLFFYPIGEALAAQLLGIMPEHPWSLGGGDAKRMAVESLNVYQNYLKEGIPSDKMEITGKPSVDQIYDQIQEMDGSTIRDELGIKSNQKMILCSVPQLAEHSLLSWEEHWQEIDFLFASLTGEPGVAFVLSLHPQSNPKMYQEIAGKYGAIIAPHRIYELIPICDFLVSTFSSVVVQAIGCGKPAIIVDFIGLNSPYFDQEPGVIVINERDRLIPTVKKLIYDDASYQQLVESQIESSSKWILLDGKCTQRVVDLLYEMLE